MFRAAFGLLASMVPPHWPDEQAGLLASRTIISTMPTPTNERQALECELREELPAQLAAYQQEFAAGRATVRPPGRPWSTTPRSVGVGAVPPRVRPHGYRCRCRP